MYGSNCHDENTDAKTVGRMVGGFQTGRGRARAAYCVAGPVLHLLRRRLLGRRRGVRGNLRVMIPRIRTDQEVLGQHLAIQGPYVHDTRFHDIPNTVRGFIRALPDNCVAVSLRIKGGPDMIRAAEREARRKGVRILWL